MKTLKDLEYQSDMLPTKLTDPFLLRKAAKEWIEELNKLAPRKVFVTGEYTFVYEANEKIESTIGWIKHFFNLN